MANEFVINLTLYGQRISGIKVPIGSTVKWNLTCENPLTRAALDLTAFNVVHALSQLDLQGNPKHPAIIPRQATITDATHGLCYAPWASGDTVPFNPGIYGLEIWTSDSDGDRVQSLGFCIVELTASAYQPNDPVTALPEQAPLALGPKGDKGDTGAAGPAGPESLRQAYAGGAGASDSVMTLDGTRGTIKVDIHGTNQTALTFYDSLAGGSPNYVDISSSGIALSHLATVNSAHAQGTFYLGSGQTGSDSTDNLVFTYQATEASSLPWNEWFGAFDNSGWVRKDQVHRRGINVAAGGGRAVGGLLNGTLADEYESSYYDGVHHQMERHHTFVDPSDTQLRYISFTGHLDSPYGTTLALSADTISADLLSLTRTTSQLVSVNNNNSIYIDDNQAWLKARAGDAYMEVFPSGEAYVNAKLQGGLLGDGATIFQWNPSNGAFYKDLYFAAADATNGAQLKNTPNVNFRGHYWSSGNQASDFTMVYIMDSTDPTSHLEFKVGGATVAQFTSVGGGTLGKSGTSTIGYNAVGAFMHSPSGSGQVQTDDANGTFLQYGSTELLCNGGSVQMVPGGTFAAQFTSAGMMSGSDGGMDIGSASARFRVGYFKDGVQMGDVIAHRPSASSAVRGLLFVQTQPDMSGSPDLLQICLRASDNSYQWINVADGDGDVV